jgi:hypothetical protein
VAVFSTVHMPAIQSMVARGGQIYRYAGKVSDDVRDAARAAAPRRTGGLRRSIFSELHTQPLSVKFTCSSFARHARWVERGTADAGFGVIFSIRGRDKRMVLYQDGRAGVPARYQKHIGQHIQWVSGQRPQPYLETGLYIGMLQNGLV